MTATDTTALDAWEAIHAMLAPRSVVLVGASADESKFSGQPLRNLQTIGYPGPVYVVNRRGGQIRGVDVQTSIGELPRDIDVAFVMVPAADAVDAVAELGDHGVRTAIVAASGFAELGTEDGRELQDRLAAVARAHGVRVLGPNCNGVYQTRVPLPLGYNKTHSQSLVAGSVALISHSGALLGAYLPLLETYGGGLSTFISCGNEVDLSLTDFVEYLADDPDTSVIALLMDGVDDGPRFRAAVRRATDASKTVVALKLGNSASGTGAALAHSSRLAGSRAAYEAVFEADGIVQVRSVESLALASSILGTGRRPSSRSVIAVSTSGGGGVLLADLLDDRGVATDPLSAEATAVIEATAGFASAQNPFDIGAAGPAHVAEQFLALLEDPAAGALVFLFTPTPTAAWRRGLSEALAEASGRHPTTPVIVVCPAPPDDADIEPLRLAGIPVVASTTEAVDVLAALQVLAPVSATTTRAEFVEAPPEAASGSPLSEPDSKAMLARAGITFAREALTTDRDSAAAAAADLGFPVVLKAAATNIAHKSDHGLVVVGLADRGAVETAFDDLARRARIIDADGYQGVIVAELVADGMDVVVGVTRDRDFGPLIVFGAGGVLTELIADVAVAPVPLNQAQARSLVESTKIGQILAGYRGGTRLDVDALVDTLVAVSVFAAERVGDVEAIDLNPVRVGMRGAVALDALIVTIGENAPGASAL